MYFKKGFAGIVFLVLVLLITSAIVISYYAGTKRQAAQDAVSASVAATNPTEEELLTVPQDEENRQEQDNVLGTISVPTSNSLPGNGYSRQKVVTDRGTFTVSIAAADLNSARVIADTASSSNCGNDCSVMALKDYVSRNGAFAGINGPYFCPATYASCSGKKNSFDTLIMNKNKVYFNSDNNVYSTIPAAIFYGNTSRFVNQSLEWGRDTGVDSVIANYPLLVRDGNLNFTGSGDGKLNGKGNRSFIGGKDNYAYIGVVSKATVADAAVVLKTMGMKNALNLDSGGSTALWFSGYKFGPGRGLPIAILFVRK
ncbi:MAG: phosphodiester glycosidase family protein [Patescibacteria group bacterium]